MQEERVSGPTHGRAGGSAQVCRRLRVQASSLPAGPELGQAPWVCRPVRCQGTVASREWVRNGAAGVAHTQEVRTDLAL